MNDYTEVRIKVTPCSEYKTDIVAALLADVGFESFVADETGLTAYIPSQLYNSQAAREALETFSLPDTAVEIAGDETVEGRDWNSEWEKNFFQPIVIGGDLVVHSSFHTDYPSCRYDITIDPKMAFGTGHHSTTSLIATELIKRDIEGKSVVDMGTGTGILAILAAMRGASPVTAIEIDEFAHANALENIALNNHPEIDLRLGDAAMLADIKGVDLFIANINRNIITADLGAYCATLASDATMLLSGFYVEDIPVVAEAARAFGLHIAGYTENRRWACLTLTNSNQ